MSEPVTCPACGSTSVRILTLKQDGVLLEACLKCASFWEAELRTEPEIQPCDNCAWRPGSPERSDPEKWQALMADFRRGATFYCHKRVPALLDPKTGYSFDHKVEKVEGRFTCTNADVCASWLAWKLGQIYRASPKPQPEGVIHDTGEASS